MKKFRKNAPASQNVPPADAFLPMSRAEMEQRGWDALDILLVTGDAYVDHPAFGVALLGRWLMAHGFRVGIIAQPRWKSPEDVQAMGRPRLFAGVTAGALDSMLAHYTAFRKKRRDDVYTPGGASGARPNRASIVYTGLLRQAFPGLPVVLGGIEASLRRITHYDFWTDALRRPILLDSKADLLVYGMAERALLMLAQQVRDSIAAGEPPALQDIPGTAWMAPGNATAPEGVPCITLPAHEEMLEEPRLLLEATMALEQQIHNRTRATQRVGNRTLILAPPAAPLNTAEMDALYALPFTRRAHPAYTRPIPALEMLQFSITAHRGCGGGCSFCSLALHQGRRIQSRSEQSIRHEAEQCTLHPDWRGALTDIGGPTANMWQSTCTAEGKPCRRPSCLTPEICPRFKEAQQDYLCLLDTLAAQPGIRHLRVASGIRHDLALKHPAFIRALAARFTGGQLKLAPEHKHPAVLKLMRKPPFQQFVDFCDRFEQASRQAGKRQYIIPYLITAFPGCTDAQTAELARWFHSQGWKPEQIQCFIPTPGTLATAMFFTGLDPEGKPIHVARTDAQRMKQHYLLLN